jgi:uncharacterized protein (DUF488 family)
MSITTLYTIGHGNKSLNEFIEELRTYSIEYLFDVRSFPMSKYNPHFNRPLLDYNLGNILISYTFLGEYLGGLPKDRSCFTDDKVDYKKIRGKSFFQEGIQLLIDGHKEKLKIALMCSEQNPEDCHRSKLIGEELLKHGISLNHITPNGLKKQERVISELTKGNGTKDLFGKNDFTSRNKYINE